VTYAAAQNLEISGDLGRAAELFASLGDYQDAREQSEAAYDAYYQEAYERAQQAITARDYKTAIEALAPLDRENPGEKYSNVDVMYKDAVYRHAEELYEQGKAYEALPFYRSIADYRDVSSKKLTRYAYRILGKWESTKGVLMEFREDGSCTIDGREMFFLAALYRLSTGDLPGELSYTHNIVRLTDTGMTLRDESTQKIFKMTRAD
jgi:tetratricopeptide (TPR) repeat protein